MRTTLKNWLDSLRHLVSGPQSLERSLTLTIGGLLLVHYRTGLRGRRAARWVLVAYLLLTLAYVGVKFVTDVLLA